MAAIFEADLMEEQYAYRPNRSALGAVGEVHQLLNRGYKEVVDADLSSYFDTIPHHELMQSVARRVSDGALLALVKGGWRWPWKKRTAKEISSEAPSTRTKAEAPARGADPAVIGQSVHAPLPSGLEDTGWKRGCKHASSTTQMTS
jgi:RNA-directed DNA polymerase